VVVLFGAPTVTVAVARCAPETDSA